jgi:hypothetical protein
MSKAKTGNPFVPDRNSVNRLLKKSETVGKLMATKPKMAENKFVKLFFGPILACFVGIRHQQNSFEQPVNPNNVATMSASSPVVRRAVHGKISPSPAVWSISATTCEGLLFLTAMLISFPVTTGQSGMDADNRIVCALSWRSISKHLSLDGLA